MRVAQLDRASDYGSEGREFESSAARQNSPRFWGLFFILIMLCEKRSEHRSLQRVEKIKLQGKRTNTVRP